MSQKIVLSLLLVVIAVVFYYSWLPDPSLANETYLPKWLLNWSNHYYNLRTAVPFFVVGFLLEFYSDEKEEIFNQKKNFIQNIGFATIIVCIAEGGQFLIQKRSPDLMDIFYGIIGSLIGSLGYNLMKKLKNAKQT